MSDPSESFAHISIGIESFLSPIGTINSEGSPGDSNEGFPSDLSSLVSDIRLFPVDQNDLKDKQEPESSVTNVTASPSKATDERRPNCSILDRAERMSTSMPGSPVGSSGERSTKWSLCLDWVASAAVRQKLTTHNVSPSAWDCYWDSHDYATQKVSVRIRPMSPLEIDAGARRVVSTTDKIVFPATPPRGANTDLCRGVMAVVNPSSFDADPDVVAAAANAANFPEWAKVFTGFDHCFWAKGAHETAGVHSSQLDVYIAVGKDIVSHVCRGMSSTCIAYGHCGSGKSYSMFGSPTAVAATARESTSQLAMGLVPRVFSAIVRNVLNPTPNPTAGYVGGSDTRITLSFYELHNDKLRDLLTFDSEGVSPPSLKPREHPVVGPYVSGLRKIEISSVDQLMFLLNSGHKYRANKWAGGVYFPVGRAHAVITLELTPTSQDYSSYDPSSAATTPLSSACPTCSTGSMVYKCVKVQMVDLAGPEKECSVDNISSSGGRQAGKRDTKFIAQSLAVLGSVIRGLGKLSRVKMGRAAELPRSSILSDSLWGCSSVTTSSGSPFSSPSSSLTRSSGALPPPPTGIAAPFQLPFRESLLTWLLKEGLCHTGANSSVSGNCFVSLLAHISPAATAYDETLQTLTFADSVCVQRAEAVAELRKATTASIKKAANEPGGLKSKLSLHSRSSSDVSACRTGVGSGSRPNLLQELISDPQQRLAKLNMQHQQQLRLVHSTGSDDRGRSTTPIHSDATTGGLGATSTPTEKPPTTVPLSPGSSLVPDVGSADYKELQTKLAELNFELQNTKVDRDSLSVELSEANGRIMVLNSRLVEQMGNPYHAVVSSFPPGVGIAASLGDVNSDCDSVVSDEPPEEPIYSPFSSQQVQALAEAENTQNVLYLRSLIGRKDTDIDKLLQELAAVKQESARLEDLSHAQRVDFKERSDRLQELHEATLVDSKRLLEDSNRSLVQENTQLLGELEGMRLKNMELSLTLTQRECSAQESLRDLNSSMRVVVSDRDRTLLALSESEQEQVSATEKLEQLEHLMSESSWQSLNAQLELEHAHIHEAELAAELEHLHETLETKSAEVVELENGHRQLKNELDALLQAFGELKANFRDDDKEGEPDGIGASSDNDSDGADCATGAAALKVKDPHSETACAHDLTLLKSILHKLLVHYCPHAHQTDEESQGFTIRNLTESIKVKQQVEPLVDRISATAASFRRQLEAQNQLLVDAGLANDNSLALKDASIVELTEEILAQKQLYVDTEARNVSALEVKDAVIENVSEELKAQKQLLLEAEAFNAGALAFKNKTIVTMSDELRVHRQERAQSDATYDKLLAAKDQTIADLTTEASALKQQLDDAGAAASSTIVAKDVTIVTLTDALDDQKQLLSDADAAHSSVLAAKNKTILGLTEDLQNQKQLHIDPQMDLSAKDETIADLTEKLQVQTVALAVAETASATAISLKNSTIVELKYELEELKKLQEEVNEASDARVDGPGIAYLTQQLREQEEFLVQAKARYANDLADKDAVIADITKEIEGLKKLSESEMVVTNAATAYWETTSHEQAVEIERLQVHIVELRDKCHQLETADADITLPPAQDVSSCDDMDTVRDPDAHLQQKLADALRESDALSRKLADAEKAWDMVQKLTEADNTKAAAIKNLKQQLEDLGREKSRATRHYEKACKQRDALKQELSQIDADLMGALQHAGLRRSAHGTGDGSNAFSPTTGRQMLHEIIDTPPAIEDPYKIPTGSSPRNSSMGRSSRETPPHRMREKSPMPVMVNSGERTERPLRHSSRNRGQRVNPNA